VNLSILKSRCGFTIECLLFCSTLTVDAVECEYFVCSSSLVSLLHVYEVSEEEDVAKSWQMPLLHFTSKRRGSQKGDRQLARSIRWDVDMH